MPYGYGSANTGSSSSSSGSSHDRGGGQHRATATRQVAASRARDRHPTTESTGREQAIANRTYSRPDTVTYGGPNVHGEGLGSQTFNKNLRTIQRRHDYNRLANQRAHPFLSKLGGIGGLLKGIGKAGLSFFGGIPGQALSGILTAKNWAKQKGSGVLQGIGEFGDTDEFGNPLYPTWDRYINRNTGKYDDKPYLGQGQSNYTFDDQVVTDVVNPNLNNLGVDNQFIEEEQNFDPNFLAPGAAEGGRIGYATQGFVDPEEPAENIFNFMQDQNIPFGEQVEGEEGTLEQLIAQYIEAGFPPDQAEEMAMRELQAMSQGSEQGIARLV